MKTFVLFLVVLVSSSTFAWPNLRQTETPEQEAPSGETFEQEIERCEKHLKCEAEVEGGAKRQVEDDAQNKEACERLFDEAEKELGDLAERSIGDDEGEEKERKELIEELEKCKKENDVACDGGSKPETRFLRHLVRNMEGDECLGALRKVRKLREGEEKCQCGGKESQGEDRNGSGDRQRRPRPGGEEKIEQEVARLISLLEKK